MVRPPTALPVTVTEQVEVGTPGTRAHEAPGANASPAPVEDNATVPVGADFVPAASVSVTLTVTVPACPARSGLGETDTDVEVERGLTFRTRLPWLAWKTPPAPA